MPIVNLQLHFILITSTVLFVFNTVINTLEKPEELIKTLKRLFNHLKMNQNLTIFICRCILLKSSVNKYLLHFQKHNVKILH